MQHNPALVQKTKETFAGSTSPLIWWYEVGRVLSIACLGASLTTTDDVGDVPPLLVSCKSFCLSKANTKKRLLMIATIFDRSPSLTFRELLV